MSIVFYPPQKKRLKKTMINYLNVAEAAHTVCDHFAPAINSSLPLAISTGVIII